MIEFIPKQKWKLRLKSKFWIRLWNSNVIKKLKNSKKHSKRFEKIILQGSPGIIRTPRRSNHLKKWKLLYLQKINSLLMPNIYFCPSFKLFLLSVICTEPEAWYIFLNCKYKFYILNQIYVLDLRSSCCLFGSLLRIFSLSRLVDRAGLSRENSYCNRRKQT